MPAFLFAGPLAAPRPPGLVLAPPPLPLATPAGYLAASLSLLPFAAALPFRGGGASAPAAPPAASRGAASPAGMRDACVGAGEGATPQMIARCPDALARSHSSCSSGVRTISPLTSLRLIVEFQRILTAPSVRPGRALAISVERLPFDCFCFGCGVGGSLAVSPESPSCAAGELTEVQESARHGSPSDSTAFWRTRQACTLGWGPADTAAHRE